ncbi:MAG: hypothetical protein AAF483_22240 [Planctomycetota bacterium]
MRTTSSKKHEQMPASKQRKAFLLILVMVVLAMASLAALNFSRSMLVSHSSSRYSNARLQARMCAESGAQAVRLFLAYPQADRLANGGTWDNPLFYAVNVMPDTDPSRRGNYSIRSTSMDDFGNFGMSRSGLQNESAKLNLNVLVQLDDLASSGALGGAAVGGSEGGGDPLADMASGLVSEATSELGSDMAMNVLLALPGMTEQIAMDLLDYLDADDFPRDGGSSEFEDYYAQLPTPYRPANGPINSIEELLKVRGITPVMLFGYDENRNGVLDPAEQNKMNMGLQPGAAPGAIGTLNSDPNAMPPPPLGWSAYLTIHSEEKNVSRAGYPRININSDDLVTLYADLTEVLGNETWASFIIAFRMGGTAGGDGQSPLVKLASMAAAQSDPDGVMGQQIDAISSMTASPQQDLSNAKPWSSDMLDQFDLTQGGSVKFNQVLDLFDATVTAGGQGGEQQVLLSPFQSIDIFGVAAATEILMDELTTVEAPSIPGRINVMECPVEILNGIPGMDEEKVEAILEARVDGSESATRFFETWLVAEGILTMDEMRALLPLLTCGGDVFKCQIVGYMEGDAAFSRLEAIISAAGDLPEIKFVRRLDHLGRGFDIQTLGQRFDAGMSAVGGMGGSGAGVLPGAGSSAGQPGGIQ